MDAPFGALALGNAGPPQSPTGGPASALSTGTSSTTLDSEQPRDPEGCMGWLPVLTVVPRDLYEHAGYPERQRTLWIKMSLKVTDLRCPSICLKTRLKDFVFDSLGETV